jgi:hypothetical protein
MLLEAFELAPMTKLLFATDASWSAEPFFLATVLAGNARRIYG